MASSNVMPKHWHNRYVAWQNRDQPQRKEAPKIEAEQIKLFSGVPGDDVTLFYKMIEVFDEMRWVDAMD
jgi:hypothetical protein